MLRQTTAQFGIKPVLGEPSFLQERLGVVVVVVVIVVIVIVVVDIVVFLVE